MPPLRQEARAGNVALHRREGACAKPEAILNRAGRPRNGSPKQPRSPLNPSTMAGPGVRVVQKTVRAEAASTRCRARFRARGGCRL